MASAKRERLQDMRSEASRAAASQPLYYSPSLLQPQLVDPPVLDSPSLMRRFDIYTDPTLAFPPSKRMRGVATLAFNPSSPYGSPPPPPPFFPTVQQFRLPQPPDSGDYSIRSGDSTGHRYPSHSSHSSNSVLRSPHFDPGESPIRNMRNSRQDLNFGRGRARQFSGGRREQNYKNKASARDDIENYFSPSMLEDPWRDLQPVVGNILEPLASPGYSPLASPGYSLPESKSEKQSKLSEKESSSRFTAKSSLAEFLAASFEEAISDDE